MLEAEQSVKQRAPLALCHADREQHQQDVVAGLLDLDALLVEEQREDLGGDTAVCKGAGDVHAGRRDRDLDRVQHAEAVRDRAEPVPWRIGLKRPTAGLGGKQIVGCLREGVLDP